eukprot:29605-Pelagococcus_subviridis.AAC.11
MPAQAAVHRADVARRSHERGEGREDADDERDDQMQLGVLARAEVRLHDAPERDREERECRERRRARLRPRRGERVPGRAGERLRRHEREAIDPERVR